MYILDKKWMTKFFDWVEWHFLLLACCRTFFARVVFTWSAHRTQYIVTSLSLWSCWIGILWPFHHRYNNLVMHKHLSPFLCLSEWNWVDHMNWVKQAMPNTYVVEWPKCFVYASLIKGTTLEAINYVVERVLQICCHTNLHLFVGKVVHLVTLIEFHVCPSMLHVGSFPYHATLNYVSPNK